MAFERHLRKAAQGAAQESYAEKRREEAMQGNE
jgi:hypothetical protein